MDSTYHTGLLDGSDEVVALKVDFDDFPGRGPRKDCDNVTHLYTWARGYESPDENPYDEPKDFVEAALREAYDDDPKALVRAVLAIDDAPFRVTRDDSNPDGPTMTLQELARTMLVSKPAWLDGPSWPASDDGLGDVDEAADEVFEDVAGWPNVMAVLRDRCAMLPIYMLDHSGIAYSTTSFADSWDSSQVGWGYMSLDETREVWGVDGRSDADMLADARHAIASDVKVYSSWVEGDVWYGEVLSLSGDDDDSCGGFYGYESDEDMLAAISEALGVDRASLEATDAIDDDEALDAVRARRDRLAHERAVASGNPYHVFHYHKVVPIDVTVAVPADAVDALDAFTFDAAFCAECDMQRDGWANEHGIEDWQDESDVTGNPDEIGCDALDGFVSDVQHAYVVDDGGHVVTSSADTAWARGSRQMD